MLGLALAFPLCIGTALVMGTVLTYVIQPAGNAMLLFSGVFVAFAAVCLAAYVHRLKEKELGSDSAGAAARESGLLTSSSGPSMVRKLSVCIVGGVLMSLWNPLVTLAEKDHGLSPYGELTFYTLALLLSTFVFLPLLLRWPLEGGKGTPVSQVIAEFRKVPRAAHLYSFLGGFIWCFGTLSNAVAGDSGVLPSAASYAIGQCANMIAILWGVFYFGEFVGTSSTVKRLLVVICVLYVAAIALIALAMCVD
eukprot:TRINITY_DN23524_c0_g1_i2.p1 TRINITY_DN23524_c0_g1~~TRINITY_DN23524_c0_g1_i2.p1  ORF type:complete len:251 (-),score=50.22 TRINITY_DN23524_c0_g1_i2:63-815(-)